MTDINNEQNDIDDNELDLDIEDDEHEDIETDEQPSEAKPDNTGAVLGQIRKVENLLKEGKEVPKDLMWTMAHIDSSIIKPEPEEDDFDKRYARRRDSERYEEALDLLEDELDESEIANIKNQIDELKSEHPTFTSMKAYELIMRPVQVSESYRRKTRLKSQAIIPGGNYEKPDADAKAYKEYCDNLRMVGLTPTREKFDKAKKANIL